MAWSYALTFMKCFNYLAIQSVECICSRMFLAMPCTGRMYYTSYCILLPMFTCSLFLYFHLKKIALAKEAFTDACIQYGANTIKTVDEQQRPYGRVLSNECTRCGENDWKHVRLVDSRMQRAKRARQTAKNRFNRLVASKNSQVGSGNDGWFSEFLVRSGPNAWNLNNLHEGRRY